MQTLEAQGTQNPRKLAISALERIEKGGYSNIIISDLLKKNRIDDKDRALFSAIVKGVTERRITLDHIIASLSSFPLSKIDTDALMVLRIGIYQLLYMDSVPKYAAVNECVSLSRKRSKGFVNAVLRNFIRSGCRYELPDDPHAGMSVEYSVPVPLLEKFISVFGEEKTRAIFEKTLEKRYTDVCVNTLKADVDSFAAELKKSGYHAERGALSQYCVKTDAPYYFLEDRFTGEFLAMDEASQLCGASLGVRAGDLFLDTCSAPGSKSYVAAMSMNNTGRIVSSDLHSSKLSLIASGADRLGIKIIETREADARDFFPDFERAFDCVLCDVPCSGLGVIGGKPEIKYKNVKELSALPDIQYAILSTSSRYVKAGGTLVYSTCTVLPEENELNVQKFLSANSEFSLEPFKVGNDTCDGMITLTPDVHGTDGFFIAKLKRKS